VSRASDSHAALLQLSSVALPVGAFSYSQGLESAIDSGRLACAADIARWIEDHLVLVIGRYEAPLWWRLYQACVDADGERYRELNDDFLASRESAELRAETLQMGHSMAELLRGLGVTPPVLFDRATWPALHVFAAHHWGVEARAALTGYLFGWAENQVMAAIKCFAMGQRAGQGILLNLRGALTLVANRASEIGEEEYSSAAPGLALTSVAHETQYSRLFRS
jgi:urease accessory protein